MIRYPVTRSELNALIAQEDPAWLQGARTRTQRFRRLGRYRENSGTWSRIKTVYIELQHWKCGYCERRLAAPRHGRIEHDVEHYRPKSTVKTWPPASAAKTATMQFRFPTGSASPIGYYLLAYHPLNYCTACKPCNSVLKSDYFPVSGRRRLRGSNPAAMKSEQPLLLYPLGDIDDAPERLMRFVGLVPQPTARNGSANHHRAEVTIKFFDLDSREDLLLARAERIVTLWQAMIIAKRGTNAQKTDARNTIALMMKRTSEHVNCVKSFYRLAQQNPQRAKELYAPIRRFLEEQM
jgi:hypothetical protein